MTRSTRRLVSAYAPPRRAPAGRPFDFGRDRQACLRQVKSIPSLRDWWHVETERTGGGDSCGGAALRMLQKKGTDQLGENQMRSCADVGEQVSG